MAIVPAYPFNLLNGTIADATQVMADFDNVKNSVNSNAAANGANSDITALTGLTTPLSIAQGGSGTATPGSGVAGTVGGYRNLLRRNGGFEVWQRGAGGAPAGFSVPAGTTTGLYTADGWYLATNANQACTVTQAAAGTGIVGGSQWCAVVQRTVGQTGVGTLTFGFPMDVDELSPAIGKFVRLSFSAWAGANFSPAGGNISAVIFTGTGTPVKAVVGFTGLAAALSYTAPITSTPTRFQATTPAVIPVGTRQMEVLLQWVPVGTAGASDYFAIDDVQLEIVPAATGYVSSDFERLNFQEQLVLCQRHYQKSFQYAIAPAFNIGADTGEMVGIAGHAGVTAGNYLMTRQIVPMRVSPSIAGYNPAAVNAVVRNLDIGADTSLPVFVVYPNSIRCNFTGSTATAVGNLCAIHFTADAGI